MGKFDQFIEMRVRRHGLASVTFQIDAEIKHRVDQVADQLGRASAEVYRELVKASIGDLERAVRASHALHKGTEATQDGPRLEVVL